MNDELIRASELANYVYCECCWADEIEGKRIRSAEMLQGIKGHDHLQWMYATILFFRQILLVIVIGSAVLLGIILAVYYLTGNV